MVVLTFYAKPAPSIPQDSQIRPRRTVCDCFFNPPKRFHTRLRRFGWYVFKSTILHEILATPRRLSPVEKGQIGLPVAMALVPRPALGGLVL